MFKRIKSGWQLTKKSWGILSDDPGLIKFPIVGGIVALLVAIVLIAPGIYLLDSGPVAAGVVLLAVGSYLSAFVVYYFAVGLAHNADKYMQGEALKFGDGMALANSRMSAIAGWAFVATVVMTLVRTIQERFGVAGAIFGGLAGAAWGVFSFLAVPVIAVEGTGPISTLKRCGSLVKQGWGEQITGTIAIGGIIFFLGFVPAALLIVGGVLLFATTGVGGGVLIAIGIIVLIIAGLIQQALSTIFGVALYRWLATQQPVGTFTEEEMQSAVRTKSGRLGGQGVSPTSATTI